MKLSSIVLNIHLSEWYLIPEKVKIKKSPIQVNLFKFLCLTIRTTKSK